MNVRQRLKRVIEGVLGSEPVTSAARLRLRHRALILAYHNVVPDGTPSTGDQSLHLPVSRFAEQLDVMQDHFDVVPIPDVLSPSTGRPRIAITFDDAYRGTIRIGLAELARRELPSTVFVTPGLLGSQPFWWDSYADPASGLSSATRTRALGTLQGKNERVRAWASSQGTREVTMEPDFRTATEEELRAAVAVGGVLLGSHTWTHPALPTLDAEELRRELERPLAWLRERFACAISWLTYPYGLSNTAVEAAARTAGYEAACRVGGGWVPRTGADRYALPRQVVPRGLSAQGFSLRLSDMLSD